MPRHVTQQHKVDKSLAPAVSPASNIIDLTTSVAERLAMWALDDEALGSSPGTTNFSELD